MRLRRFLVRAAIATVAGVAVAAAVYETSLEPGAALARAAFQAGQGVTPPAGYAAIARAVSEVAGVPVAAAGAPAAQLDVYRPRAPAASPRPVILWVHGGGFVANSAARDGDFAVLLAHAGYVVANLNYSLAPGSTYPVPVRQANAALAWLGRHAARYGGDPAEIFAGGDSAGAQIASQLAALQSNPALAAAMHLAPALPAGLRGVVLYCGLYDMATVGGTGFPALRTFMWAYTGRRDWSADPAIRQLSTTDQVTARYPPTYLTVGDKDPFRTQAAGLAAALRRDGVPVTTLFWSHKGLGHEYQFDFRHPEAATNLRRTLQFLAARSAPSARPAAHG